MEILTIRSTDAGVGFLIKADGVTIFHGGDHANTGEELKKDFTDEIDYLLNKSPGIDIAFMLTGSPCGSSSSPEVTGKGLNYFIQNMKPKVFFPMHQQSNEHLYKIAAADVDQLGLGVMCLCAEFKGDRFFYNGDVIK